MPFAVGHRAKNIVPLQRAMFHINETGLQGKIVEIIPNDSVLFRFDEPLDALKHLDNCVEVGLVETEGDWETTLEEKFLQEFEYIDEYNAEGDPVRLELV